MKHRFLYDTAKPRPLTAGPILLAIALGLAIGLLLAQGVRL